MGLSKTFALALCFSALALPMIDLCYAQNSPQDYIDPHNSARASVGVGSINWDDSLASYAQNYANQRVGDCNLVHSRGPHGENLFWGSGKEFTAADAVGSWVDEIHFYDYNSNTCQDGKQCGHYTQVVWRDSVNVGCARVQCTNGAWFINCNYSPPGNFIGQKPY